MNRVISYLFGKDDESNEKSPNYLSPSFANIVKKDSAKSDSYVNQLKKKAQQLKPAESNPVLAKNLEELKYAELETQIKKHLDYVLAYSKLEVIVNDRKYLKKVFKISQILYAEGNNFQHLFRVLEFDPIVKHIILLLKLTKDCSYVAIIDYYGRRQSKNAECHESHNLDFCLRGNHIFYALINVVSVMSDFSKVFRNKFEDFGGTKVLLDYLSDKDFLEDAIMITMIDPDKNTHVLDLYKNCIVIIQNLSKSVNLDLKLSGSIMMTFSKLLHESQFEEEHIIIAYMFLAKMLSENDLEKLQSIHSVINKLAELARLAADAIRNQDSTNRTGIELDDNRLAKVCQVDKNQLYINVIEILETIFYLNANEKLRTQTLINFKLLDDLKTIILYGKDVEVEFSLKVIFQYCFDEKLIEIIAVNTELMTILKNIIGYHNKNPELISANIIKYTKGILWKMNRFTSLEGSIVRKPENKVKKIFISHETKDRELFIKIEQKLKENGFKVWFNDLKVNEYNLEKTILAIKNSDCIIMGLSNSYKFDLNCRIEAEYSAEIKRMILPLDIEDKFVPDGWVQKIVENKVYIDFRQNEFENATQLLIEELNFSLINNKEARRSSNNLYKTDSKPIIHIDDLRNGIDEEFMRIKKKISDDVFYKKNSRGTVKKYDVIISAHYNNYNTAMKIKEKIEELDLTTWTSLDKKTNNSDAWNPDAMNSTIKHCECVIICLNKDYEMSGILNLEAAAIIQSKKPIIPVIMDNSYKPGSLEWVNNLLSKKQSISLDVEDMDISGLKKELSNYVTKLKKARSV